MDQVEPHLIHVFDDDFYGEELKFLVCGYVRPERSFPSLGQFQKHARASSSANEFVCFCDDPTRRGRAALSEGIFRMSVVSDPPTFHITHNLISLSGTHAHTDALIAEIHHDISVAKAELDKEPHKRFGSTELDWTAAAAATTGPPAPEPRPAGARADGR